MPAPKKPQDRRPPARKHTASSKMRREEVLSQGYKLTIEGVTYQAELGDVTPAIARDLRRGTGFGFLGLMMEMAKGADIDLISAAVWVARRIDGEIVDLEDVVVDYAALMSDDFEVEIAESDSKADAPNPEA